MSANIKPCKDCGGIVSKSAKTCPHCGAPAQRETIGCGGAIAIFIALGFIVSVWEKQSADPPPPVSPAQSQASAAALKAEQDKQPGRRELIEKLISLEVFTKVEKPAQFARAYVGKSFHNLTVDDKAKFINVVWAYYKTDDPKADTVIVRDGYTGKDIGDYSEAQGGLKMK